MNIIELAEKLKPGMKFRRKSWVDGVYRVSIDGELGRYTNIKDEEIMPPPKTEILATDWEIIEEKTAYQKCYEKYYEGMKSKSGVFNMPLDFWNNALECASEYFKNLNTSYVSKEKIVEEIQKLIEK